MAVEHWYHIPRSGWTDLMRGAQRSANQTGRKNVVHRHEKPQPCPGASAKPLPNQCVIVLPNEADPMFPGHRESDIADCNEIHPSPVLDSGLVTYEPAPPKEIQWKP